MLGANTEIPPEADVNSFDTHDYDGDVFSPDSLIGPGFRQYPLTPLEGSHSVPIDPQTPFQAPVDLYSNDLSLTEPRRFFEPSSQFLAQTAWPGAPAQQATGDVNGQLSSMALGFMLPNEGQYPFDLGYFPPADTAPPPYGGAAVGEGSVSIWRATEATAPDAIFPTVPIGQGKSDGGPNLEKVKKKNRGRPRLYGEDGTERPKRKPGRPPTYVVGPESASSTSPYQYFRSAPSASESTLAISPGWPGNQELGPSFSSNTSIASIGSGPGSGAGPNGLSVLERARTRMGAGARRPKSRPSSERATRRQRRVTGRRCRRP